MTFTPFEIGFEFPFPPSVNKIWIPVPYRAKSGKWAARMILSNNARAYKEQVGWMARAVCLDPFPFEVDAYVYLYRPRRIGDTDNFNKILFDGLNGIVYEDDKQIRDVHTFRRYDKNRPRVEVYFQTFQTSS